MRVVSNLSFTATFYKHKPPIFLEKVGGLWFFTSEKRPYRSNMGRTVFYSVYSQTQRLSGFRIAWRASKHAAAAAFGQDAIPRVKSFVILPHTRIF
ncbi:hypothetical protein AZH11_08515 [Pseudomonas simiae]|nr:hypothetical protein AZH11_08515 [Pseudomonas simiae]